MLDSTKEVRAKDFHTYSTSRLRRANKACFVFETIPYKLNKMIYDDILYIMYACVCMHF